ncbi:DNA-binding protein [Pusillimonas sp. TS35]|uniref:Zn-ribbon domain-containing OB-fold protein n=1 Tax=Paracandidimonas lactea TaxID=2895524 RepID=UPI001369679E|nr:Zn-ribbon domain-containing OB-fold protein [Paracandidimonas lactea]MYN13138.1 DNA-binding protein [Pusillimonas sp. TS35]
MSSKQDASPSHAQSDIGADLYYRTQLDQGSFQIQRCASCERSVFYPRMLCPHCGSDNLTWYTPSGEGEVYSTTIVRRKPEHGGDYNVALIDLKEGVRMMSRVDGIAPDAVQIGMPVKAGVVDGGDGKMVVFTVAGDK